MTQVQQTVIIVAGGRGERMQTNVAKQFLEINTLPVLMHTIGIFHRFNSLMQIIVALPPDQIKYWEALCKKHAFTIDHKVIAGGATRFETVLKGLAIAPHDGIIAIHDGVRPLVSQATISRCFDEATMYGTAIPVLPPVESIREIRGDESVAVNRNNYRMVQTPQVFQASIIHKAYESGFSPEFTDDASVVEKLGVQIKLVEGNPENIKITSPIDLKLAAVLLSDINDIQ